MIHGIGTNGNELENYVAALSGDLRHAHSYPSSYQFINAVLNPSINHNARDLAPDWE